MNDLVITIISGLVTVVILPLLGAACDALIKLIKRKTQNETAQKLYSDAVGIVYDATKYVFQTYVDELKKNGSFDVAAQREALLRAKETALLQMSDEIKSFILGAFGSLDKWLETKIEATINTLKTTN